MTHQLKLLMTEAIALGISACASAGYSQSTTTYAPQTAVESRVAYTDRSLVDIASSDDFFDTLVAAVKAASLADTLSSGGPYTVFAPTNAAFNDMDAYEVLKITDKGYLDTLLKYHVVPGRVLSSDLRDGMMVKTLEGSSHEIDLTGGASIGEAQIVRADIEASNGVIHVIDTVLMKRGGNDGQDWTKDGDSKDWTKDR